MKTSLMFAALLALALGGACTKDQQAPTVPSAAFDETTESTGGDLTEAATPDPDKPPLEEPTGDLDTTEIAREDATPVDVEDRERRGVSGASREAQRRGGAERIRHRARERDLCGRGSVRHGDRGKPHDVSAHVRAADAIRI